MYWRRYPPLSISLPFLAVGALPMMTTRQRAIRGFLAASQPYQAGLRSICSEFPESSCNRARVNSEFLIFNSLTAADAVPRRDRVGQRVHSLHGHQQPETDIELKSTRTCRCVLSVVGASLHCQADLGAVGLYTEDPVFSCPSLQPPLNEAPRLPTSPPNQTPAIPTARMR